MRLLVTGVTGQIGGEFVDLVSGSTHEVCATDRQTMDITKSDEVDAAIAGFSPDVIVNCAAFTAVDLAEDEPELAFAINDSGVRNLSEAAAASNSHLIHLSTDYVFDGLAPGWYDETAAPDPQGVYGKSKLAGEAHVLNLDRGLVLRTAWVYSARGKNFVKTIRRLASERSELSVVSDQLGCPTSAKDVAFAIAGIIDSGCSETGIFNVAAPDEASWHELAVATVAEMGNEHEVTVHSVTTEQYPTRAFRPPNSRLASAKLSSSYGIVLPRWRDSLREVTTSLEAIEATSASSTR